MSGRSLLHNHRTAWGVLAVWLLGAARPVLGCATCFGKSDSDLAQGMNMGILALLGFVALVLSGIAAFFIFLARRSGRSSAELKASEPVAIES